MQLTSILTLTVTILLTTTSTVFAEKQYSNTYMTCLVNKARQQAGLDPLGIDDALTKAAQIHSDDMARMNNMDHTGSDGSSPGDRCQAAGFQWTAVAENIAYGQDSMDEVMRVWMDSPGHRENILNPEYKMFGSAVSMSGGTPYYTQDFGCDSQPVRNVPTCDGDYPDMASPSQTSGGGNSGGNDSSARYGGGSRGGRRGGSKMQAGDYGSNDSFDNGGGDNMMPMRGSNGKRPRYGRRQRSGGNDNDWFASQGFGQNPFGGRQPRGNFGNDGGMFSNGGLREIGGNFGGFGGGGMGGGFGGGAFGGFGGGGMGGFY